MLQLKWTGPIDFQVFVQYWNTIQLDNITKLFHAAWLAQHPLSNKKDEPVAQIYNRSYVFLTENNRSYVQQMPAVQILPLFLARKFAVH
jgi:hypothetical protein